MTVRQRVLEARLAERISKNPQLAKQMGIEIKIENKPTKQQLLNKSTVTINDHLL